MSSKNVSWIRNRTLLVSSPRPFHHGFSRRRWYSYLREPPATPKVVRQTAVRRFGARSTIDNDVIFLTATAFQDLDLGAVELKHLVQIEGIGNRSS